MKPKAVLVSEQDDLILEGLIYGSVKKTINCKTISYTSFEYDYCQDCDYYICNIEAQEEILELKLERLLSHLISYIFKSRDIEEDSEDKEERIVEILENTTFSYSSLGDTCKQLTQLGGTAADYCRTELRDFIEEYENMLTTRDRSCVGGTDVLERDDCRHYSTEDFEEVTEQEVSVPSHLWLKVTFKKNPEECIYCLLALIEHEGFILAPLTIGNVYSYAMIENDITLIGKVCWGDLNPSSRIQVAYNQFWNSIFNKDLNDDEDWLNSLEEYAKELLENINFRIKRNTLCYEYRNNLLLTNGLLKDTIKLQLL